LPGAGETVARSEAPAIGRKASRLAEVQDGNRSRFGGARGLIEPGSYPGKTGAVRRKACVSAVRKNAVKDG
jgi:hypothetical protein